MWFFNNWVNQVKLCWTVQLVHQIFTRGSAVSTSSYYLVFIHQCSSIKCKSPWGYLLLGTTNYWKNPSESTLTRLEQVENTLSGQTQHDSVRTLHVFSSKITSFTSNAEKIPIFFFPLNSVTSLFTTIHTASPKLFCQFISLDLLLFLLLLTIATE